MKTKTVLFLGISLLLSSAAHATNQISRFVLSAGATGGGGATHVFRSTLGQTVVGSYQASTHAVRAGFWSSGNTAAAVEQAPLPTVFRLERPSPNPFQSEQEIRYDVPAPGGVVTLRIYDVRGRLVRTLLDRSESPGRKRMLWDGRDNAGSPLGLGVYLLAFDAPRYHATYKTALLH